MITAQVVDTPGSYHFSMSECASSRTSGWVTVTVFGVNIRGTKFRTGTCLGVNITYYNMPVFFRETVTNKGSHWEPTKVAVHVTFPPDAVSEDRLMTLRRWKPSVCSPPLLENEAIVSDVVELSTEISEGFVFNKEVTLAISHSAPDLKGYEVVVKQLIDRNSNEWVDVDKTHYIRSLSGKEQGMCM